VPWFARLVLRHGYTLSVGYAPQVFDWVFAKLEDSGWVQRITSGCASPPAPGATLVTRVPGRGVHLSIGRPDLGQLRDAGALDAVTVTYLTDPAVHRMWVHPSVDHHLTVTEAPRDGSAGLPDADAPVGGLVSTRFNERLSPNAAGAARGARLSLDRPVALVSRVARDGRGTRAVREIAGTGAAQVLVLCGRNAKLRAELAEQPGVVALGWRKDVPDLMAISDVLVHNAGGLSVTEALTAGLPAVTYRPIPGHGIANAATLAEAGLAPGRRTGRAGPGGARARQPAQRPELSGPGAGRRPCGGRPARRRRPGRRVGQAYGLRLRWRTIGSR